MRKKRKIDYSSQTSSDCYNWYVQEFKNSIPLQSMSLITPLLTTPSKGVNNALSAGMQSSIVHTLRRHGKQRCYKRH